MSSRVDLHPTTSRGTDADDVEYDEGPSLETRDWRDGPHVDPENPQIQSARRNRRSRILHTLNIGRMRHATPQERIEALRRLRNENQASDSFAEQSGGAGSRFSRRVSRAFGGSRGGSRRASAIANSRPMSEVGPSGVEPAIHPEMRATAEAAPRVPVEAADASLAGPAPLPLVTVAPVTTAPIPTQIENASSSAVAASSSHLQETTIPTMNTTEEGSSNTNKETPPATGGVLSPVTSSSAQEEPPITDR